MGNTLKLTQFIDEIFRQSSYTKQMQEGRWDEQLKDRLGQPACPISYAEMVERVAKKVFDSWMRKEHGTVRIWLDRRKRV